MAGDKSCFTVNLKICYLGLDFRRLLCLPLCFKSRRRETSNKWLIKIFMDS